MKSISPDQVQRAGGCDCDECEWRYGQEIVEAASEAIAGVVVAEKALSLAQEARRASVVAMVDRGRTYREVGALLGLSHQRIAQLVKAHTQAQGAQA